MPLEKMGIQLKIGLQGDTRGVVGTLKSSLLESNLFELFLVTLIWGGVGGTLKHHPAPESLLGTFST